MRKLISLALSRWAIIALFLSTLSLIFLLGTPHNNTAEATHNYSCSVTTSSTAPGGNVSVRHSGLTAGETFRMYGTNVFFAADLGNNNDSTTSTRTQTFNVPSNAPAGNYRVEIDFRFHSPDKEDCNGSFQVAVTSSTPCTFHLITTSVAPGGNVQVQVDTGDSSHQFLGFIATVSGPVASGTRPGLGIITITAPGAGSYSVGVVDNSGGPTCTTSASNQLTVTGSTPTSFTITPSFTGTAAPFNVTVNWTPTASGNVTLIINDEDDPAKTTVWSNTITGTSVSMSTSTWTVGPGITVDGIFKFTIVENLGGTVVSNQPTVNLPGPIGPGDPATCSVSTTSVTAGGQITVTGANMGNNALPIGLTPGDIVIGDKGTSDPFTVSVTVPTSVTAGSYTVYVDAGGFGKINCTGNLSVGSGGTPSTSESCPATATNSVEAINKLNCTWISAGTFDDKPFVKNQIFGITDALYLSLTGLSRLNPEGDNVTAGSGALTASRNLVATLYSQPPVSGVSYIASQFSKFNPVQPAYAQEGIGYNALKPVQTIWEAFRNISYVGFIIVFIVIGFMIMFRAHISPQAVATVQDSLPRVVIALILVTFSYAIAGLMIDVMFLLLNVFINALKLAGLLPNYNDNIFTKSVFGLVWGSWTDTFKSVADSIANLIDQTISVPVLDKILGFFGGTIGAIVMGVAILYIMFRVFFMLLIAYATIIIMTIAAPFYFLFQALPGNNGAKDWFKQMAANISVFPVTALMFVLAGILGGITAFGGPSGGAIGSEQVGQFPLLTGGLKTDVVGRLIGIGLLLMTPQAADMVKKAIGAQTPGGGNFGAAGAALAGAGGVAMGIPRFAGNTVRESSVGRAFGDVREYQGRRNAERVITQIPGWMYGRKGKASSDEAKKEISRGRLPPST